MRKLKALLFGLAAVGFVLACTSLAFLISNDQLHTDYAKWATAVISVIALAISTMSFYVAEQRTRFTNAFAIANKWDEEPILKARVIIRNHLRVGNNLAEVVRDDEMIDALTHFFNYYWDMGVAIETDWTDASYLRLRFRLTLRTLYPAMLAMVNGSNDAGAMSEGVASIDKLRRRWEL